MSDYHAVVIVVEAQTPKAALEVLGLDGPAQNVPWRVAFVGEPVPVEADENASFEHLDQWESVED